LMFGLFIVRVNKSDSTVNIKENFKRLNTNMSVNCSNIKLNHYALKVHRLRRGLKSRLFLIINLLKCHVVKWISAECFATESLAPKVHSFGLTLWDSKTQNN
jgi:hypothetical protein